MKNIQISIIEDNKEYREVLEIIINGTLGFECLGVYPNGTSAIAGIRHQQPDVVLTDLGLPDISGIECIQILKDEFPSIQFMVISISDDEEQIFNALSAGAEGYLTKGTSHSKIIENIKILMDGGAPMSASIAKKTLGFFNKSTKKLAEAFKKVLGKREIEVLEHLVKGWSYKKVATEMFISVEAIKTHCHNIYKKLHVTSKGALIHKVHTNDPFIFRLQEEIRSLQKKNKALEEQLKTGKTQKE